MGYTHVLFHFRSRNSPVALQSVSLCYGGHNFVVFSIGHSANVDPLKGPLWTGYAAYQRLLAAWWTRTRSLSG